MDARTALVTTDTSSLLPSADTWRTMVSMAAALFESGLLPDHIETPQAAVAIVQKGVELRVPPMYALSTISVINGKPACAAELMLALIYREQGDAAVIPVEANETICTMQYKRRSWPQYMTCSFTIEDAKRAGLLNVKQKENSTRVPPWIAYPAAMLHARCVSKLARIAFPDVIAGMYTKEELGGDTDDDAPPTPPTRPTIRPDAPLDALDGRSDTRASADDSTVVAPPSTPQRASQEQYDAIITACQALYGLTGITFQLHEEMTETEAIAELACIEQKITEASFSAAAVKVGMSDEQRVKVERAHVEYAKLGVHLDRPPVSYDTEQIARWLDERRSELPKLRKTRQPVAGAA